MDEEDCGLCMLPSSRHESNDLSVVDPPSERCKQSSIYLTQNDFFILLALVCSQINPSFTTKSRVRPQRSHLSLHFNAARLHSMSRDGISKEILYARNTESGCKIKQIEKLCMFFA